MVFAVLHAYSGERDRSFRSPPQIGHVQTGIVGHVRPESSVTIDRNDRSRCSGIPIHIAGALLASFALGLLVVTIDAWERKGVNKRRLQEMAISLGVPVSSLDGEEMAVKVIQYSSARYSGELLRNRLADLCGLVRTGWGYLSNILQVIAIGLVAFEMYDAGSESAALMWSVPAIALFFWLVSVMFSFTCLLITGRYPGEPKASRVGLAALIEQRGAARNALRGFDGGGET